MLCTMRLLLLAGLLFVSAAQAVTLILAKAPPQDEVYLQVGSEGAAVDTVSFDVTPASMLNNAQVAGQPPILIIARARSAPPGRSAATLTVDSSTPLTSGAESISFSQIGWTSSNPGEIAPGGFTGGTTQTIAEFQTHPGEGEEIQAELSFYYLNQQPVGEGTYTGRVVYTLSMP